MPHDADCTLPNLPQGMMAQLWVYKWLPVLLWTATHLCGRNLWHFNGTSSAAAAKKSHFNGKRVAPPSWPTDCTSSMETGWQAQFVHFSSNNEKCEKFSSSWNRPLITSFALFGHQQHPVWAASMQMLRQSPYLSPNPTVTSIHCSTKEHFL